jgi:transcription termination/antitermination protein NusG
LSQILAEFGNGLGGSAASWYAVYTSPRHEKKVAAYLDAREIEHYVPLYSLPRRWKDGSRVIIREPLFPNYVFVHIPLLLRVRVLSVPGVLWIVGSRGPEPLADDEMEILRSGLQGRRCEPHPFLTVGERVRVCRGPLSGAIGIVTRIKNELRLVISMELLMRSVAVEVDAADLEAARPEMELPRRGPATVPLQTPARMAGGSWAGVRQ